MSYELFYWPQIPGRGEFVRLALEAAGAAYVDVARAEGGVEALMDLWRQPQQRPPFAPPILRIDGLVLAQTANILQYLGPRLGLVPGPEADRLWAHQLQLTIADLVVETHNVHHPVSSRLYYEDQGPEALKAAAEFHQARAPRFIDYFETVLASNPQGPAYAVGDTLSYVDLSLFHVVEGLRYAFPRAMARLEARSPNLVALHGAVAALPRIQAYLGSPRRLGFNEMGVFRHYPELDG